MAGFDNPLWRQIQKIELKPDGTLHVPATANAEDGIVLGEGLIGVPPTERAAEQRPAAGARRGLLARLRSLLR